ncbi:hypothetical protein JAAARDRAFT_30386 [Jaapia argillacea MUCL 33604]|uniref:DUF6534 domain-containing protein n=1 Tax=Jaapia argillacea MUCL 33604 TaxID=933084 RepID=A0A067QG67_9AGAM|nr:hypothetical protein JAAARDRAFT_30386 [Jaapia argillacea MUCL 33604]
MNPAEIAHGPALIGLFFNILLFGIMTTQTFLYFHQFKKDRVWMKVYVAVLYAADMLNVIFDCIWIYQALILNFGNIPYLGVANWVFATDPATTAIIATMVQLFFAWRVKVLTGNWFIVTIILSFAIASGCGGLGTAIAVGIVPEFIHFQDFRVIVIVWLISTVVCDVIITASLTWHLKSHRTGFPATDDVVNKIIRLTVQTGMMTAILAIVDLGVYLGNPTGLHLAFNFPLSKLYTNSLMSTLNSRSGWKYNRTTEPSQDPASRDVVSRKDVLNLSQAGRPEVFVHVESHQMVDMDNKTQTYYSDAEEHPVRGYETKGSAV